MITLPGDGLQNASDPYRDGPRCSPGECTMSNEQQPNPLNPVQRHVDQIVDDLSKDRITPKQRAEIGKALQDAAVRSITKNQQKTFSRPTLESEMAIGNAVEKGPFVCVYDERGRQLFTKTKGTRPGDGLKGYTGTTVDIRYGSVIYTYDEKGREINSVRSY
jgi:hypothetical protein